VHTSTNKCLAKIVKDAKELVLMFEYSLDAVRKSLESALIDYGSRFGFGCEERGLFAWFF